MIPAHSFVSAKRIWGYLFKGTGYSGGLMQIADRARIYGFSCALAMLLTGALNPAIHGQGGPNKSFTDTVTFHLNGGKDHPPVKILHVMLDQTEIPLDTPVHVEGMWMRKLSFVIQNVSNKAIVRAGITLTFPDAMAAANGGPTYPLLMGIGNWQRHALMRRDGSAIQLHSPQLPEARIAPDASFTLRASPDSYADEVQQQTYGLASHITGVIIHFDEIYFDDESKWMTGIYYLAVPPPTLWQSITPEEFFAGTSPVQPK